MSRAERREERRPRVEKDFGAQSEAALDLFELVELAWHDCYGESTPPDDVIDDILVIAAGDLDQLIRAGRLAVTDRRDLRIAADGLRNQ